MIRPASSEHCDLLTDLALRSKAHWGYGADLLELWQPDLTITLQLVEHQSTWVAYDRNVVVGFYSLELTPEVAELEHLWVEPDVLRRGVGSALLAHAIERAASSGARELLVVSDPNAEGFYVRLGGVRIGEHESVPTGRKLPVLRFDLKRSSSL